MAFSGYSFPILFLFLLAFVLYKALVKLRYRARNVQSKLFSMLLSNLVLCLFE